MWVSVGITGPHLGHSALVCSEWCGSVQHVLENDDFLEVELGFEN